MGRKRAAAEAPQRVLAGAGWPRARLSPAAPLGQREDFAGRGGCLDALSRRPSAAERGIPPPRTPYGGLRPFPGRSRKPS